MPTIYLSPSTREFRPYSGGGNEEYYMNLIVDELVPFLNSSGIKFYRNNPNMPVSSAINQANKNDFDLYLALNSNVSSELMTGQNRGMDILYTPGDPNSHRLAKIIYQDFKKLYPYPEKIKMSPAEFNVELKDTIAPAISISMGYHDNPDDAMWIRENIENIAETIATSLAEYFGIPLIFPQTIRQVLTKQSIDVYIRPYTESEVINSIPAGTNISILGEWGNWYVIDSLGNVGYAEKESVNS